MDIIILRNVQPEDEKNLALALEKAFSEYADNVIVKIDEIRKQKKAEYDKQRYQDKKNFTVKNSEKSEISQEERENEKEDEKEKRTKKEKEEERVKEKEELINIYAPQPEKPTATEKAKPQKHAYGSGKNVLLTDEEYNKLRTQYPDADQKIENMSLYFLSKGNAGKYKSHYATFLNWERMAAERDARQMQPKQIPKEKTFRDLRIEMEQQEQQQDLAKQDYFVDSFWRA